ncbi:MAG: hypothetical protein NC200_06260, partial [Candidatus Gastranaerophilales bacterium]|nr:hypothetical protein [Candidatus Gastranaerophilales bacterium]
MLDDENAIKTLVHEYAHYVNYLLDKKVKNLEVLFKEDTPELREELLAVTHFVDKNATCHKLFNEREKLKQSIKKLSDSIKIKYP